MWLRSRLSAVFILAPALAVAQTPLPSIKDARCDDTTVTIIYQHDSVLRSPLWKDQTCADLKIADDRRAVGWTVLAKGFAKDDKGTVLRTFETHRLFVNGRLVPGQKSVIYQWGFLPGTHRVIFEAGPLYGGGDYFLYDPEGDRIVETCERSRRGSCPAWAKSLEAREG